MELRQLLWLVMVGLKGSPPTPHSLSSPGPQWLSLVPCAQPLSLAPAQWLQQDRGPKSREGPPDSVEEFSQQSACQAEAPSLLPSLPLTHALSSFHFKHSSWANKSPHSAKKRKKKGAATQRLESRADIQAFNQACFVVV